MCRQAGRLGTLYLLQSVCNATHLGHYCVTFFSRHGTSPTMMEWTGIKEMLSVTRTNLELYLYDSSICSAAMLVLMVFIFMTSRCACEIDNHAPRLSHVCIQYEC